MLTIIKQVKRIWNDDGRNDRSFDVQEERLRKSLMDLKQATNALIRASQMLHDLLASRKPPSVH